METEYLVLWTAEAKIQYNDILLFWAENNNSPKYAISMNRQVETILDTLRNFPKIGTIYLEEKNIRRIVILRNFSMYYRIIEAEKEVQIITFVDNRSNPKKLKF